MRLTTEPAAPPSDQAVPVVPGGAASWADLERRRAPDFVRAEPRPRARTSLRGWLSPAERKNSWPLAEVSGDATPDALQHRLRRALWDPEAVCDALRRDVIQHLGASGAVLVIALAPGPPGPLPSVLPRRSSAVPPPGASIAPWSEKFAPEVAPAAPAAGRIDWSVPIGNRPANSWPVPTRSGRGCQFASVSRDSTAAM